MSLFRVVLKALGSLALFILWLSVFSDRNANGEIVNRDPFTQVQPRDFCMFSALYNGLEGDVYEEDKDRALYQASKTWKALSGAQRALFLALMPR